MDDGPSNSLMIDLGGAARSEAGILADELRDYLLDADPTISVDVVRLDAETQDLGATLIVLFGTPAVVAISRGIAAWLARRSTSTVVMSAGDKRLEVTNLPSRRAETLAEEIIELLQKAHTSDDPDASNEPDGTDPVH